MIVLGGGNTAMGFRCRKFQRLGGADVKVTCAAALRMMKASPWEKEDAMHEGIPIINYHVPKSFVHENGWHGMTFEIVRRAGRRERAPFTGADRRAGCVLPA